MVKCALSDLRVLGLIINFNTLLEIYSFCTCPAETSGQKNISLANSGPDTNGSQL